LCALPRTRTHSGQLETSASCQWAASVLPRATKRCTEAVRRTYRRRLEWRVVGRRAARRDAMRLPRRQFLHLAAGATALPAVSRIARAQAQDFPARPVRIITHSAPGGSPDALLRIVADRLSQMRGRQVLALNHPGAGGAVAARTAAAAAPDGYTLYMPASSAFATLPGLQANLPLEVPRDFVPVGFVGEQPFFLSVASSLGVTTLPEFIALAKSRPGEIAYAATGRGTLSHLAGEALQQRADIKL